MTDPNTAAPAAPASGDAAPAEAPAQATTPSTVLGDSAAPATEASAAPPAEAQKPPEAPVVPEKYDLKLPEGAPLDAAHLDAVGSFAKDLKLPQDAAQKLVERDASLLTSFQEAKAKEWNGMVTGWGEQTKADPEIGGEKFTEMTGAAKAAIERFGSPALKEMLNKTGAGNHPELVRIFARIGKAMADDKMVPGSPGGNAPVDAASLLYGSKA